MRCFCAGFVPDTLGKTAATGVDGHMLFPLPSGYASKVNTDLTSHTSYVDLLEWGLDMRLGACSARRTLRTDLPWHTILMIV